MAYYNTILAFHVLCVGIWFSHVIINISWKSKSSYENLENNSNNFITYLLHNTNLIGIIGTMGVLITGILMTVLNPSYNFFQFTANHWLVAKQVIMIVLLVLIFTKIIPTAKELKTNLAAGDEKMLQDSLAKLYKITSAMNLLVLLNLLLALSHRFMG